MPFWSNSRTPPADGPPPRYATIMKKVYPYSLRPIVIFTSCLGLIWALVMGVDCLQERNQANASSKQNTFSFIQAILFFSVAGIELVIFVIAIMNKVNIGRLLIIVAPIGVIVTLGAQVMNVALHFSLKSDLINQCVKNTVGGTYRDDNGLTMTVTDDQASRICSTAWDRGTWSVIAWLIVSLILAGIFASLAMSYYRQLRDPASVQQRRAQVESYALQPQYQSQSHNQYAHNPPPPNGQQGWMVPPYPGPPANMPPQGYEKSDYQPSAEWAQSGFGAGAGPGPAGDGNTRAQDEAWERAQASGPTAHLTSPTRGDRRTRDEEQGYAIRNQEEDDAWERAKNEGVTAHLTDPGRK